MTNMHLALLYNIFFCVFKRIYLHIDADRQTISFIEISIEAGILLGGKHKACFVLGAA
jgi:hypothetical protein